MKSPFNKSILTLLNTPKNVMPYAQDYFKIIMFGMFFMFISFLSSSILRGIGDTITPMKVEIITIILNIILERKIQMEIYRSDLEKSFDCLPSDKIRKSKS